MIELDFTLALPSFELRIDASIHGRITAVLGPSGSGKTSLLEAIAGLRPRARGHIAVDGATFLDTELSLELRPEERRIGYVPQGPSLFPHLDALGNVRYGLGGSADDARLVRETMELLEIEGLGARYPRTLSGGEAQRVALARALVTRPRLLLLDEPLSALDVELKGRILPYLMRVRDEAKVPILYVTHHAGEALALADEALILDGGRVRAKGLARDVLRPRLLFGVHDGVTFENIVHGEVLNADEEAGTATLLPARGAAASEPSALTVPLLAGSTRGDRATYSVASEEVLLLTSAPRGISARNVFLAAVTEVEAIGADVLVRLAAGGVEWRARVTRAAARDLDARPGGELWVAIKTHAFHPLGSRRAGPAPG